MTVLPGSLLSSFGPADCILRRSTFLGCQMRRELHSVRANLSGIGAKILVMHFCCFVCAALQASRPFGGMVSPWMLMVNKRLQSSHADLPSRIKCLGWPSARRQAQHGESGQGHIHIAASSVNRFAALDTSDSGLGPQAIAPQVPEQVLVPATVPSQTHRQLSTLYHSDRTPRYSKRWDVERARSESASTFTNLWT
jgi:hypothetical protein